MVALIEQVDDKAGFVVVLLMFLVGLNLGLSLLAAALWRAPVAPAWVAPAVVASVVVLLVGSDKILGAIAFALLAVAFGWVGRAVLAQSDDTGRLSRPGRPPRRPNRACREAGSPRPAVRRPSHCALYSSEPGKLPARTGHHGCWGLALRTLLPLDGLEQVVALIRDVRDFATRHPA